MSSSTPTVTTSADLSNAIRTIDLANDIMVGPQLAAVNLGAEPGRRLVADDHGQRAHA